MHTEVKQHIAILGANGFIGSHLSSALLKRGHKITAIDLDSFRIADLVKLKGFNFHKRDFRAFDNQLRILLSNCDLIVPLVAIATPKTYVTDPIGVFELDFEANLPYIRYCVDIIILIDSSEHPLLTPTFLATPDMKTDEITFRCWY